MLGSLTTVPVAFPSRTLLQSYAKMGSAACSMYTPVCLSMPCPSPTELEEAHLLVSPSILSWLPIGSTKITSLQLLAAVGLFPHTLAQVRSHIALPDWSSFPNVLGAQAAITAFSLL